VITLFTNTTDFLPNFDHSFHRAATTLKMFQGSIAAQVAKKVNWLGPGVDSMA
jgi:hypothetical protein